MNLCQKSNGFLFLLIKKSQTDLHYYRLEHIYTLVLLKHDNTEVILDNLLAMYKFSNYT